MAARRVTSTTRRPARNMREPVRRVTGATARGTRARARMVGIRRAHRALLPVHTAAPLSAIGTRRLRILARHAGFGGSACSACGRAREVPARSSDRMKWRAAQAATETCASGIKRGAPSTARCTARRIFAEQIGRGDSCASGIARSACSSRTQSSPSMRCSHVPRARGWRARRTCGNASIATGGYARASIGSRSRGGARRV